MTLTEFKASLKREAPFFSNPLLNALWQDGNNKWEKAHEIAQAVYTPDGSWVHAYLHRKEGDTSNAVYWYRKAGKEMPMVSLADEWDNLVVELLAKE